ncbi:hypothetical protein AB1Y20_019777 [Prymnesium parvum]|uniref:Uncharacterized protein n=1 Tax=Prymnesium parvum TaxID=97485 RepID=A0AB34JS26_PRYPA
MEDEVSFDKSEDDEELLSVAANDEPIDAARTSGAPSPVDGKYIVEVEEQRSRQRLRTTSTCVCEPLRSFGGTASRVPPTMASCSRSSWQWCVHSRR